MGNYLDSPSVLEREFKPLLRQAGIEGVGWHSLRHTYVSLLISQNVPIKYIQKQVGHASIDMTMDIYGHIMPEVTQLGVNALDKLFNSGKLTATN